MPGSRLSSFPASAGIVPQQCWGSLESSLPGMQPQSPNPQYDFILKDPQAPKRGFNLPLFPNLPGPAKIILASVLGLFVVVILYSVIFGGKATNAQQMTDAMGRAQEINRVSKLVAQQSNDPDTQGLAATTQIAMASEQFQLNSYLKSHKIKTSPKQLTKYLNKNTDAQLQSAAQNNNIPAVYASYLKKNLGLYQAILLSANKGASKTVSAILRDAFNSTKTLLASPQVAGASSS